MRRWMIAGVAVLMLLLGLPGISQAHDVLRGDECVIGPRETVTDNLFVLCRVLRVEGRVLGSIIGAAFDTVITGTVHNDIYLLGGQILFDGTLEEDLVFGGMLLRMGPNARFNNPRGDVLSVALSTEIDRGAYIPNSLIAAGYQLLMAGEVDGQISFWGSALMIGGQVNGDVDATVGDPEAGDGSQLQTLLIPFRFDINLRQPGLVVTADATIDGVLRYTGATEGQINGELAQPPVYLPIITRPDLTQPILTESDNAQWLGSYLTQVIREFVTLGAIGVIGLALFPRQMVTPLINLRFRPLSSLGVGLLTFVLSFAGLIIVVLLALLLIFALAMLRLGDLVLASSLLLGVMGGGAAGGFYIVALFVSRVIFSLALGRAIVWLIIGDDGSLRLLYLSLAVGLALLALVAWLPVLGWMLNFAALALGLGAILITFMQQLSRPGPAPQPVQIPSRVEVARYIPPPTIEDQPNDPGMRNLPEGFDWWGDDD